MNIPQIARTGDQKRKSMDWVWPLRRADGRTWAEAKEEEREQAD